MQRSPETCKDSVMPSVPNSSGQAPSHFSLSQHAIYLLRRVLIRAGLFPRSHNSGTSAVDSGSKGLRRDSPHIGCHVMDSHSGTQNVNFDATAGTDHRSHLHGRLKSTTEVCLNLILPFQVGVLPGLQKPLFMFVRLHRPLYASTLTELKESFPVRFFLIFLGPKRRRLDYFEVGRVFATMMVDKVSDFRRLVT
ncbi:hypothetical protein P879_04175 [Paragonimus westermani]|uniref:Band 3 cytoplasmic domain-containing protein n=1 Tax=Paragonimus westermani TaxID=34504 RepID=A0A8T0DN79_9TREM|nr:hypothetical protein P879_04175 [Paragonimus westermani]